MGQSKWDTSNSNQLKKQIKSQPHFIPLVACQSLLSLLESGWVDGGISFEGGVALCAVLPSTNEKLPHRF